MSWKNLHTTPITFRERASPNFSAGSFAISASVFDTRLACVFVTASGGISPSERPSSSITIGER
ncbi:MAG: hypothetical protein U0270_11175 [Labilithrix sp.]